MRTFKSVLLILCFILVLPSCTSSSKDKIVEKTNKSYIEHTGKFKPESCQSVVISLINELQLQDMMFIEEDGIEKIYGINRDCVEDFCAYSSKAEGNADEIAMFLIKDEETRQKVVKELIDKMSDKSEYLKKVNEKQSKKIQANSVSIHGDYILIIVCNSSQAAHDALNKFYK